MIIDPVSYLSNQFYWSVDNFYHRQRTHCQEFQVTENSVLEFHSTRAFGQCKLVSSNFEAIIKAFVVLILYPVFVALTFYISRSHAFVLSI